MQWSDISLHPADGTLRQFAILLVVFCGGLASWEGYRHGRVNLALLLLFVSLLIGIVGRIKPRWLGPLYVGWMVLVFPIGWVVSRTLLAVVYYGVITPLGLLLRVFKRDALRLRYRHGQESYWVSKPGTADVRNYFRQF
jgi:hypothetical protein